LSFLNYLVECKGYTIGLMSVIIRREIELQLLEDEKL